MGSKYFRGNAAGPGAMFSLCEAIRTGFLDVQVGWSLFDNVSSAAGSSKRIYKSPATARQAFYVEVSETGTVGRVRFRCWADWDPITHVGAQGTFDDGGTGTGSHGGVLGQDATFAYDLIFHDNGFVAVAHTTFDSCAFAGICDNSSSVPAHMSGTPALASDIIAGATSFPTSISMVGKLFVGQDLILIGLTGVSGDARFGLKERVKVTAISAAALTITATINAYKAGSVAGFDPFPIACTVQLDTAGSRNGIHGEDPPTSNAIFFAYRLDGTAPGGDGSRIWSYCFDLSAGSGSDLWGKTYRLGNLPVFQVGRLHAQHLAPLGFEAARGWLPPIVGHYRGTTQALGDRLQVGSDSWYKTAVPLGASGTGWVDIGLAFGPRPSAEMVVGTTDWQGAFAQDLAGGTPIPPAPTVTSISPSSGIIGTIVTVIGQNFIGITGVQVNGIQCAYAVLSATQLIFVVLPAATTGPVSVTNAGGTGTGPVFTVTSLFQPAQPALAQGVAGATAIAKDLSLDTAGDLQLQGQDIAPLVADTAAIISDVTATLQFMLGEWFLDQSQGIPWFSVLGQKKVNLQGLRSALFTAIAARQGITQVQFVNVTQDTTRRSLKVVWAAFSNKTQLGGTVQVSP